MSDKTLRQVLFGHDMKSTIYITLGNPLRGDDGVGPYITRKIAAIPTIRIKNAGDRPERALDWAMKFRPDTLLFIDAADFGGTPGEIRYLQRESLEQTSFSTHRMPLAAIMDWVSHETGARCHCIGIQLGTTTLGSDLSPPVQQTADRIIGWFLENNTENITTHSP